MKTQLLHLASGFVASPFVLLLVLPVLTTSYVVRQRVAARARASSAPSSVTAARPSPPALELTRSERLEAFERVDEEEAVAPPPTAKTVALVVPRPSAPAAPASAPPFSANDARAALGANLDTLPICRRGDASGRGVVEVVWTPDGNVAAVTVSRPYAGTATGACVARRFRSARIPAFASAGPQERMAMQVRFEL